MDISVTWPCHVYLVIITSLCSPTGEFCSAPESWLQMYSRTFLSKPVRILYSNISVHLKLQYEVRFYAVNTVVNIDGIVWLLCAYSRGFHLVNMFMFIYSYCTLISMTIRDKFSLFEDLCFLRFWYVKNVSLYYSTLNPIKGFPYFFP